ncbi:MAG: hypothetical protein A2Y12_20470 [Planctomycetes bacterium GWF2_42_9]|nr:MAG: hypothetical protein A2Y12_20470 [Planctomycetes bacterium GWF2_42_9]
MWKKIILRLALGMLFLENSYFVHATSVNNAEISWGDYVFIYGPGTDSAFDSNEGITTMMKRLKGRGYTGVYFRADYSHLDPNDVIWNNDEMSVGTRLQVRAGEKVNDSFNLIKYSPSGGRG